MDFAEPIATICCSSLCPFCREALCVRDHTILPGKVHFHFVRREPPHIWPLDKTANLTVPPNPTIQLPRVGRIY